MVSVGLAMTQPDSGLFFQQCYGEEFSADWPVAAQGALVGVLHIGRPIRPKPMNPIRTVSAR